MSSAVTLPAWTETSKYLSLTTFRSDGRSVSTPVWFVVNGAELLVLTDEKSGKVRRLRDSPRATVAPCDARGKAAESPVEVMAEIVPERTGAARAMVRHRYRVAAPLVSAMSKAARTVRRRPPETQTAIRITLPGR
ncbi:MULTISPECIES: PPOX class F420-dependent oxidoreductase [Parafrankia]|uniref:Pyridoxamine 5'-phosphate oxidase n=1 Tax=Parafrankia soli TaxID=2599596 RepID=A0A1S1QYD9_9ACTN|nr:MULTISPECIES: PPOX class F420-dependent oxidoreductase [Parafrankia]OHV38539.1 pyridoxamine 5'-phosphate oxidase [Parafrankia soli]TCJ33223.1 PPOX class F420-dependent oxidoreductase [Parafrankia sp. BMG5.11]CAI7974538.1 PPOX class F420-dependent oxidoreductase [Frankia sp. Hr75.2]SQD99020.1 Pyridoxamine 5'-phosphate oxidase-related FMN-binding [Parafrankia sp. Ea1.12]